MSLKLSLDATVILLVLKPPSDPLATLDSLLRESLQLTEYICTQWTFLNLRDVCLELGQQGKRLAGVSEIGI